MRTGWHVPIGPTTLTIALATAAVSVVGLTSTTVLTVLRRRLLGGLLRPAGRCRCGGLPWP